MGEASLRSRWERAFSRAKIAEGQYGISTVAVGFAFAVYANPDGTRVFPSQETVAKGLGVGPRTVSRAVARLLAEGWLTVVVERKPPFRMVTQYRLSIPPEWVDVTPETANLTDEAPADDTGGTSTRQESPLTKTETMPGTPPGVPEQITTTLRESRPQEQGGKPPPAYSPGPGEPVWETGQLNELETAFRRGGRLGEQQAQYLRQRRPHLFASD